MKLLSSNTIDAFRRAGNDVLEWLGIGDSADERRVELERVADAYKATVVDWRGYPLAEARSQDPDQAILKAWRFAEPVGVYSASYVENLEAKQ